LLDILLLYLRKFSKIHQTRSSRSISVYTQIITMKAPLHASFSKKPYITEASN